jgi:ABC-type spermidine/putrescine transport system permease subunit II
MTVERFYQLSAASPLVLPCVLVPTSWLLPSSSQNAVIDAFQAMTIILAAGAVIGGIPYAVLAVFVLRRFRGRPEAVYRSFSFVAPLIFSGVFFVCAAAVFFFGQPESSLRDAASGAIKGATFYAVWCLPVGYVYVTFVEVLRWILRRAGVLEMPNTSPTSDCS